MEDFKKGAGSRPRVLRPRRRVGYEEQGGQDVNRDHSERSERVFSTDAPRREYGERRNYGERPSRPYGERRESGYGERRSFGDRREGSYGERPHRSFGDRPQRPYGERRSFGERPSRPYGDRREGGEGRPYGERKSYGRGSSRPGKPGRKFAPTFDEREGHGISKMLSRKPQIDNMPAREAEPMEIKSEIRLNRFIANSGVCSRREADTYIQAGVVTVNGQVVTELGTKVNIFDDDVRFNGERLKGEEKVYIVMNKPKGYVTSVSDPHAEKTVMDLLKGCNQRVFPVGRLDKGTTGVLMFTNDGEMAERLTHPSYDKKKIYQVLLDNPLKQEDYDKVLSGVTLSDGEVNADELEYIDEEDHRRLGIEIHSGKNRVVRRIFESLGYEVKALDRVYFAGLTKKGLKKGEWRYLNEGEVNILKMGAYV